jgi:hypothetical protein
VTISLLSSTLLRGFTRYVIPLSLEAYQPGARPVPIQDKVKPTMGLFREVWSRMQNARECQPRDPPPYSCPLSLLLRIQKSWVRVIPKTDRAKAFRSCRPSFQPSAGILRRWPCALGCQTVYDRTCVFTFGRFVFTFGRFVFTFWKNVVPPSSWCQFFTN